MYIYFLLFFCCISSNIFSKENSEIFEVKGKYNTIQADNHLFLVIKIEDEYGCNVLHHPNCPCKSTKYLMTPHEKTAQGMIVRLEKIPNS